MTSINVTTDPIESLTIPLEDNGSTINCTISGGTGITTFIELLDTPNSYSSQADKFVKVNSAGTGIEFTTSTTTVAWGDITGTLSNQTDLQTTLGLKLDSSDFNLSTFDTDDLGEGSSNKYDQTVAFAGGTNISIGGAYPNFTLTDNSASSSDLTTHTGDSSIHFTQGNISIPASQISDFDTEVSNNTNVSNNTTHRTSNGTDHTYIDQDVTTTSGPSFAEVRIAGKIYLDYSSDTYFEYNSGSGEVELYVGGNIKASW